MTLFTDLFASLDATLARFILDAVTNLSVYIKNFVRVAGIITLILVGLQLKWWSPIELGIKKLIFAFFLIAIVSQLATVLANYNQYIGNHLIQLPNDLLMAVAPADFSDSGSIGRYLDTTIATMGEGIGQIWASGTWQNFYGPMLLAAILFLLLCALGAAAMIVIVIGKVGIALVIGLGPLFVMMLLTPWTIVMRTILYR